MHRRLVVLVGLVVTLGALSSWAVPGRAWAAAGDTSAQCQTLYEQYIEALTRTHYPAAESIFRTFVRLRCSLP
jgi:hypothetical protein